MILEKLAAHAKERVVKAEILISLSEIKEMAFSLSKGKFAFETALKSDSLSFICEVKKASPSKGIIDEQFNYIEIAKEYELIGADCVSCLTEPKWFLGSDDIFKDIRKTIALPMIRKDFTIDEYQLYESKCMGADAVLLICSLLDTKTIAKYIEICNILGLSALVETHTADEIESAISAGAKIIGVNNRNLKDFSVDIKTTATLREMVPSDILFVAESGIRTPEDITTLKGLNIDAVLIGEALMRAQNKKEFMNSLKQAAL